jgi:nucleotidyltransferase/DNA polymerase involved in DNA repair
MSRTIVHLEADAFFASVEQALANTSAKPWLRARWWSSSERITKSLASQ